MLTSETKPSLSASVDQISPQLHDDSFAVALRGFGPIGIASVVVIALAGNAYIVPVGGLLVLAWAWRSHTPWSDLGFVRPHSWLRTVVAGIAFGIAFKVVMKAIVMPLLGADPINQTYHYLAGNRAAMPGAIWLLISGAGFGEETVFRGYFFERLGKLLGHDARAKAFAVLITATLFALAHYADQGLPGVQQATFTGLVFGTVFAITGRIWLVMFAHAAFDLTALAMIYWNVEPVFAHLLFK